METEDFPAEEGARVADWLDGLQFRGLCLPEGLTVDQAARERDGARAAAAGLAGEVWGEGTGIEARVQSAQFVSAHAAAMDWQAEANRRDLPPHARATAQRLARQLMALTTAQLGALCRLRAEQRKDRVETARLAERQSTERFKAGAADMRTMIAGFERTSRELARVDREALAAARAAGPPQTGLRPGPLRPTKPEADPGSARGFAEASGAGVLATPKPLGAGVPEPPPEPPPPLNRRQRRTLARLRRREGKRGPSTIPEK